MGYKLRKKKVREEEMPFSESQQRDRTQIKERLPYLILENNLFLNGERARFSVDRGGVFRCPVCGCRIGLYRKKNSSSNPWGINGFGHCTCFSSSGHASDTFGVYAAINNISDDEAFRILMREEGGIDEEKKRETAERIRKKQEDEREKERKRSEEMQEAFSHARFGLEMPTKGIELLEKRGIILKKLPEGMRSDVGYLSRKPLTAHSGRRYWAEGIMFRLSERSYQLRRSKDGSFIGKSGLRFLTAGPAYPFNMDSIRESGGPILITEGPFDAMTAAELGLPRSVATCGAGNHSYIVRALKDSPGRGVVYVGFDEDPAGEKGGNGLLDEIRSIGGYTVFRAPLSGGYGDINAWLMKDADGALVRIRILNGIAKSLSEELIDKEAAEEMLRLLRTYDESGSRNAKLLQAPMLENLQMIWKERMVSNA